MNEIEKKDSVVILFEENEYFIFFDSKFMRFFKMRN